MQVHVGDVSAVGEARRLASGLSRGAKFNDENVGRSALVAAELATNLLKHAGGGDLYIQEFAEPTLSGVELLALDRGPGIADINRCLQDGYSTAGSAGTGLGAIVRNSDYFDHYTKLGKGTALLVRMYAKLPVTRPATTAQDNIQIGALALCYPGETENGDAWAINAKSKTMLVADGLGHGPNAALPARVARDLFNSHDGDECVAIMERINAALTPTRGAAIAVARVDETQRLVRFVGIGNITGSVLSNGKMRRMISHNGIAGHRAPRIVEFTYPYENQPLIILHSDGVSARWDLSQYPGLEMRHAALVAGVLFRDYRRTNDDATIAVLRVS